MAVLPPWRPEIEVSGAEEAFLPPMPPKLFRDIVLVRLLFALETFGVLGDGKLVDNLLDGSVHKDREVIHSIVDTVIGHT